MPLDTVVECIELPTRCDREYLNLRGEVLPFLRLRDEFELDGEPSTRQSVVVVQYAGHKVGLVVDRLHGSSRRSSSPWGLCSAICAALAARPFWAAAKWG